MRRLFSLLCILGVCCGQMDTGKNSDANHHNNPDQEYDTECQQFNVCVEEECKNFQYSCLCQCALASTEAHCFPEFGTVCQTFINEFDEHCMGNNDVSCTQYHEDITDCGNDCMTGDVHQDSECDTGYAIAGTYDESRDAPECVDNSDLLTEENEAEEFDYITPYKTETQMEYQSNIGKKKCCDRETVMCIACQEDKSVDDVCDTRDTLMGCSQDHMFPPEFVCPFEGTNNPCTKAECSDTIDTLKLRDIRPECMKKIKSFCSDKDQKECKDLKKRVFHTESITPSMSKIIEKEDIKLNIIANSVKESIEIGIAKLKPLEVVAHLDTTRYESDFKSDLVALTPHGQTFQEPVILELSFNFTSIKEEPGSDKLTNNQLLDKVKIIKAQSPDSLIWTEVPSEFEIIDLPTDTRKRRSLGNQKTQETVIVRKLIRVPVTSFSVYAVVSSKTSDSDPATDTIPQSVFEEYHHRFDFGPNGSKNTTNTKPYFIAIFVSIGCIGLGALAFTRDKKNKKYFNETC